MTPRRYAVYDLYPQQSCYVLDHSEKRIVSENCNGLPNDSLVEILFSTL